nr:T9SS type A sorting domain-containing protein [Calditrichia bacterium]
KPTQAARAFNLSQNYPNPFNGETEIRYNLPKAGPVELAIYDLLGRRVVELVDREQIGGPHRVVWNGQDAAGRPVASGVYFYRLRQGNEVRTRKLLLLR